MTSITAAQIIVFNGFDELDVIGIYESLRMAQFDVSLVSLRSDKVLTAINGLKVIPDSVFDPKKVPPLLCVPGGGWLTRSPEGAWAEAQNGEILAVLRECFKQNIILAAVCTGALLLGHAGLLRGRRATTNRGALEALKETGAIVESARVVDDGNIITAGGITSSLDLGLWLTYRLKGKHQAAQLAQQLEFDLRGPIWQNNQRLEEQFLFTEA